MSLPPDITRWNRAGLHRFEYVDGTGPLYLEKIKEELRQRYKDKWKELPPKIELSEEVGLSQEQALYQKNKEIIDQYFGERQDIGWEMARVFSQACHVLTGHINEHANEAYLRTATQWDSIRRLVELIDYHPAAATSATTQLVLQAKEKKTGIVEKGFQVQNTPPTGGKKVVFETQEELLIDSALNELRPAGWDVSEDSPLRDGGGIAVKSLAKEKQKITPRAIKEAEPEYSNLSLLSVKKLQNVGNERFLELQVLAKEGEEPKIKDLLKLDLENPPEKIKLSKTLLRELKAKAKIINEFEVDEGLEKVKDTKLSILVSESDVFLMENMGYNKNQVIEFKKNMDMLAGFLDHGAFNRARLRDLFSEKEKDEELKRKKSVATFWKAEKKPLVEADQVAMVMDEKNNIAEAVTIDFIEEEEKYIHLLPSKKQYSWTGWWKGNTHLHVAPRWKRECWLNNEDRNVIRTEKPHGFTKGDFICWKGYSLLLSKVNQTSELVNHGKSLVIIAEIGLLTPKLHIRIFDPDGHKVVDKEYGELEDNKALKKLEELMPFPSMSGLSEYDKQKIIEYAAECAGYTNWRYAKVKESDKRDLRLELTGSLPQKGTELYDLGAVNDNKIPAGHKAVAFVKSDKPPEMEDVKPSSEAKKDNGRIKLEDIFTLKKVLSEQLGGGGLLPPGALPKIGSFLFPSPMLPMDLVKAAVELMLSMGVMAIPSTEEFVIKGMPFGGMLEGIASESAAATELFSILDKLIGYCIEIDENGNEILGTDANTNIVKWNEKYFDESDILIVTNGVTDLERDLAAMLTMQEAEEETTLFQKLKEEVISKGALLTVPEEPDVKAVVSASDPLYMFDADPGKLESGDWVVARFIDGLRALQISAINEFTDEDKSKTFSLSFVLKKEIPTALLKVYANFRGKLIPEGSDKNTDDVDPENIELEKVPDTLTIGRKILLSSDKDGPDPTMVKIEKIEDNVIKVTPPAEGFSKGNLVIRANVVNASHGTVKPVKRLSSGAASQQNYSLLFDVKNVSSVPDPTFPRGVRSDVDIVIDNLTWQQVARLDKSKPTDSHYAVQVTEDGYLNFIFGGRRLPSGANNVSVFYRVGAGRAGNLDAGSLTKAVQPHPLVDSIKQPAASVGGEEMEAVEFMRENAPATLLALERSVSLPDFENLAMSRKEVWQAKSFYHPHADSYLDQVSVVIVPSGGGKMSTTLLDTLIDFLSYHAVPTVTVRVEDFVRKEIKLEIELRVDRNKYDPIFVMERVRERVLNAFHLEHRKISRPFYLSEVYLVVEATQGVSDSQCRFQDIPAHHIFPEGDDKEKQVLYLTDKPEHLLIEDKAYIP